MKKNTLIVTAALALILIGCNPSAAAAQTASSSSGGGNEYAAPANPQYTLLEPIPCLSGDTTQTCTNGVITKVSVQTYILYIFKLAIAVAVFLAVVMITFAGFKYMTEESITEKGAAREMIQNAVLGLLGALGSYIILYTINPQFVNLSLIQVPTLNIKVVNSDINRAAYNNAINQTTQQTINAAIDKNAAAVQAQQTAQATLDANGQALYADGCIDETGTAIADSSDSVCAADGIDAYTQAQSSLATAVAAQTTQKAVANIASAETAFNANTIQHNTTYAPWPLPTSGGTKVTVGNTSPADLATALASADAAYSTAAAALPNGDVTDKAAITAQHTYTAASTINDYNTNLAINQLANDVNSSDVGGGTSGTQPYAQLKADIASAQAQLTALQNNAIPTSYVAYNTSTAGTQSTTVPVQGIGNLSQSAALQQQYNQNNTTRAAALQTAITTAQHKLGNN